MLRTYYRVHSADEAVETVLNPKRPDGWTSDDESTETQPHGVSVCASLDDLRSYIRYYSMNVQSTDRVIEILGVRCADDRDRYAARVEVKEIVAIHPVSILDEEE